jgi:pyridinium-3,5-biscarboxylic acid mononucleotide synthase
VNRSDALALLQRVAAGEVAAEDALRRLALTPVEELPFATVDTHRALRIGAPEVIFGQGKTPEQIVAIAERLSAEHGGFLATRLSDDALTRLGQRFPDVQLAAAGRSAYLAPATPPAPGKGTVLLITAGTADLPVAEECAMTSRALGDTVQQVTDVGVAGIHRLLARRDELAGAAVVIVVAGMDGALPSVVGGLVPVPVIAVPTSVGYGASFGGVAALLTMLNSCASGVTVVNIDNGFGAAFAAARITHS